MRSSCLCLCLSPGLGADLFRPTATASGQLFHAGQILIATVGLPARGKTHLSHALERYLLWLGVKAQVFSLGDYRRKRLGKPNSLPPDYFAPRAQRQPATEALRARLLNDFDDEILAYFQDGNQVVIYDANNGQEARRAELLSKFEPLHISVMFLETVCDDPSVVEHNVRSVKLLSPDYQGWPKDQAVRDFYQRIATREAEYETITSPAVSYVKSINAGQRVIANRIQGYLQSRIYFFLMNVHNRDRTIYLARAGEALVEHLYKADADLSSLGWQYAEELTEFMEKLRRERTDLSAISSPVIMSPRLTAVGEGMSALDKQQQQQQQHAHDLHRALHRPAPHAAPQASTVRPAPTGRSPSHSLEAASPSSGENESNSTEVHGKSPDGQTPLPPHRPRQFSRTASLAGSDVSGSTRKFEVWTSNRRRAAHTCSFFPQTGVKVVEKSQLCELNPGEVDGLSESEIKERFPAEYERYQKNPYGGRFPRAESYHDLCVRIEPVIMELERTSSDVLIVAQASVLRVLLGYLQGRPPHQIPSINVPEGDIREITPQAYNMQTRSHRFWNPVVRRMQRDQAWVREQRAVSRSRSRASSRASRSAAASTAPSASTSPQFGPRGANGRHSPASSAGSHPHSPGGTHQGPLLGAGLQPLTPAHVSGETTTPSTPDFPPPSSTDAGAATSMPLGVNSSQRSHAHVPGHAIPPLDLSQSTQVHLDTNLLSNEGREERQELEAEIRRQRKEEERAAVLDQLADELGDATVDEHAPSPLEETTDRSLQEKCDAP